MDLIIGFFKKYKVQVLLVVVLIVVLIGGKIFRGRAKDNYNNVDMRVTQAINKETLNSTVDNEVSQSYLLDEGGLDMSRVQTDDAIFGDFLNMYLVWSTAAEFNEQKGSLYASYRLEENSNFVKLFFPKLVVSWMSGESVFDKWANLDIPASISFGEFDSHVIRIDADKYSYSTLVPIAISCDDFSESADFLIFLYC